MTTSAIVLAAGQGTRMKSDLAKVLHLAAGRSLLDWVLAMLEPLDVDAVAVVVGHQADEVDASLPEWATAVIQAEQLGTGDAAKVGLAAVGTDGTVLVVPGDMPLLESATLAEMLGVHRETGSAATVLTVRIEDPTGYGRVLRDGEDVVAIVEQGDADHDQLMIDEVNTSVYAFDAGMLASALERVGTENSQGEFYLTDVIGVLAADGHRIRAVEAAPIEGTGVNSHDQLAAVAAILRARINKRLLADGVWMLDPSRVYIDHGVAVAGGARLYPDTILEGSTVIGAGAEVGPSVHARNTTIEPGATVRYAVLDGASVGPGATIGPFTYLRPGAVLSEKAKAGAFVEIKNSEVGPRSKVPHLSYIGDTTIGEDANIGAGTVTVNYDGFAKHRTVIGDRVRIGSDTMLIAPVEVGDDAFTGAGSVITENVSSGSLAVERSTQREIEGYAERRRRRAGADEG